MSKIKEILETKSGIGSGNETKDQFIKFNKDILKKIDTIAKESEKVVWHNETLVHKEFNDVINSLYHLADTVDNVIKLTKKDVAGLEVRGGTILETTNKGGLFEHKVQKPDGSWKIDGVAFTKTDEVIS